MNYPAACCGVVHLSSAGMGSTEPNDDTTTAHADKKQERRAAFSDSPASIWQNASSGAADSASSLATSARASVRSTSSVATAAGTRSSK